MPNTTVNLRDTAPAIGCVQMTAAGNAIAAGRAILFSCTGTGTVTVTFDDGSTLTFNVQANTVYEYNWSIVSYTVSSATGTMYSLK